MKILHVLMSDGGGAGLAAYRLHCGLRAVGEDSRMLCYEKFSDDETVVKYDPPVLPRRILGGWRHRSVLCEMKPIERRSGFELYSFPYSGFSVESHPLVRAADIVHLHWIAFFVNYPTFFSRVNKPLVWTLHDQNPFLGGFHYADDEVRNPWPIDRRMKAVKTAGVKKAQDLTVVSPSRWLDACASKSETFQGRPHRVIPYGVDLAKFTPQPRDAARKRFGIPRDKTVLLFVSNPAPGVYHRKGIDMLEAGVSRFTSLGLHVCGIGAFKNGDVHAIPPIRQAEEMTALYSAADFVIVPSREDNLPNTMLEAMACGTPVIGTPVGGMVDFIRTGETGVLARDVSVEALCEAVREAVETHSFDRAKIRAFAEENFALEKQARAYCEAYREVLERGAG